MNTNTTIDTQTGIGGMMGIGLKYDIKSSISFFANPYMKDHTIIPFDNKTHSQHFLESAFRFGITYQF